MKIKTILFTVMCFACTSSVFADFTDGDFTFRETGPNCTLVSYSGAGGDVIIPSTATKEDGSTYVVTAIGDYAFDYHLEITSVVIPDGILEIGMNAFSACYSLAEVIIPNSVTSIGGRAFDSCSGLASMTIPNSVTTIGEGAFASCSGLASITIPSSVTVIGEGAFRSCRAMSTINVADGNIAWVSEDGVLYNRSKSLLHSYPAGKRGSSFTIPSSVMEIGDWAFYTCDNLSSITIPNSVTIIGRSSFRACQMLTAINVADGNTSWTSEDGVLYNKSKSLLYTYPTGKIGAFTIPSSVTEIGDLAFYICDSLSSITIPNSVTTIGNAAFTYCRSLTELVIPNSVTVLGESSFFGCISLTSITIPNSVRTIGNSTFGRCEKLTSITIPNSVTTIGEQAFSYCYLLRDITVSWPAPQSVNLDGELFYRVDLAGATLHVPPGTRALYREHRVWGQFGTIVEENTGNPDGISNTADKSSVEVTVSDRILTITSPSTEHIEIYSPSGALLHKTATGTAAAAGTTTINIAHLPKGVLIVRGSTGWTRKIILK
ncbi:MAG: leucine-rich repeat domain-containing protein [Tannerellaceae bacterium]|jgi:hypothetical protein|nr:leucine-rich repeat domain-containing protein [Tannerellaceae bacterium]